MAGAICTDDLIMNDAQDDRCKLELLMDELIAFDIVGETGTHERTSDGLHWMYRASLVRYN